MGLRINKGPSWEEDSLGYISVDVSEVYIMKSARSLENLTDNYPFLSINSVVDRRTNPLEE